MTIVTIQIIAGIALLYIGGEFLVKSAIAISVRCNIPQLIIGLTVVALGTSLPELFVSMVAALNDAPEIATANIIGSNIINLALILPCIPLCTPLLIPGRLRRIDYPMMLLSFVLIVLLLVDWRTISSEVEFNISRVDGVILLAVLTGYIGYLIHAVHRTHTNSPHEAKEKEGSGWVILVMFVGGAAGLAFGSSLLVSGAENIAETFGISRRVIALTVVAHGTNLPEIFTAIAAIRKKESGIAVGNLIGSNIINTLFVLGAIGVATPLFLPDARDFLVDLAALIAISGYIYAVLLLGKRTIPLGRLRGGLMLASYIAYFAWVIW